MKEMYQRINQVLCLKQTLLRRNFFKKCG